VYRNHPKPPPLLIRRVKDHRSSYRQTNSYLESSSKSDTESQANLVDDLLPASLTTDDLSTMPLSFSQDLSSNPATLKESFSLDTPKVILDENDASVTIDGVMKISSEAEMRNVVYNDETYRNGLATVGFITLLFASNSPVIHAGYSLLSTDTSLPVLLLNASVSIVGLLSVLLALPFLDRNIPAPNLLQKIETTSSSSRLNVDEPAKSMPKNSLAQGMMNIPVNIRGGTELGLWKFLGTTANLYGLSLTSADHGAFLIQLTTLIVPSVQGIMGVPIPQRIWTAIALAMSGVYLFTQDPASAGSASLQGDLFCVVAAVFYATYDLRLFKWGKIIEPLELITTKVATQSALSVVALVVSNGWADAASFFSSASSDDLRLVTYVTLWSGFVVNAVAPYLQVGGQQAVGPARAQIVYASQPLWAALMSLVFLGETVGVQGVAGGVTFLGAMFLAATADVPDPDCEVDICEV